MHNMMLMCTRKN